MRGVAARPDYIAADSGSDDVGPGPLGGDTSGDTGSNSRVDLYVQIIREIATKHRLARFNVGYFHSEVDKGSAAAANARRRNRGRSRRARAA